jgi:FkbM family methyltransferase
MVSDSNTATSAELYVPHIGWLEHAPSDDVADFLNQSWFEYKEQAFLWLFLRAGNLVIDCGAHIGLYTVLSARAMRNKGRVLAIEPDPDNVSYLRRNVERNNVPCVEIIEGAAFSSSGKRILHSASYRKSAYSSILIKSEGSQEVEVDVFPLDGLLKTRGVKRVDFLKIDVEGAELVVLEGSKMSIAAGQLPLVMVEFTELNLRAIGRSTDDLRKVWEQQGYRFYRFDEDALELVPVQFNGPIWYENLFAAFDVEFVNQRLRKATFRKKRIARELLTRGRAAYRLVRDRETSETRAREEHTRAENTERVASQQTTRAENAERVAEEQTKRAENAERVAEEQTKRAENTERVAEEQTKRAENAERVANEFLTLLQRVELERKLSAKRLHEILQSRILRYHWKLRPWKQPVWVPDVAKLSSIPDVDRLISRDPLIANERYGSRNLDEVVPKISVILCTYNPRRDLLEWALQSIAIQTLKKSEYEAIIVDNNSSVPIDGEELNVMLQLPLRVIRESRQGLTFARIAGIRQARGEILVFIDDDNSLESDYLANVLTIAREEPNIGLYGGIAVGRLEVPVAEWKKRLLPHLGVRDYGPDPITSCEQRWGKWEPIGAGMVARREVAEAFVRFVEENAGAGSLGRSGSALLSGEDSLFARIANRAGYACSYQPKLRLYHFMKKERLTFRYLYKVLEGHGRSYVRLERLLGRPIEPLSRTAQVNMLARRLGFRFVKEGLSGFIQWGWDRGYVREVKDVSRYQSR